MGRGTKKKIKIITDHPWWHFPFIEPFDTTWINKEVENERYVQQEITTFCCEIANCEFKMEVTLERVK